MKSLLHLIQAEEPHLLSSDVRQDDRNGRWCSTEHFCQQPTDNDQHNNNVISQNIGP